MMRIGYGYDVHRFKEGRKCILCGVEIPCTYGPDGHSDADVPVHALMDALLGAAALGDIGKHFPDTDNKWKDANSVELLKEVNSLINSKGFCIGNADITIIAQAPKISPYIDKMRAVISHALETDIERINVKATTEEGLGFTGDMSGIKATTVVLLNNVE